jgi:5'-methylthioadenosine phosphorylase
LVIFYLQEEKDLKIDALRLLMNAELAIIGGVGFDLDGLADEMETPYGKVKFWRTRLKGHKALFIPRHGEIHVPPHRINYRAIIWTIKASGTPRVIATNTVGTMSCHPIGSFLIPQDFVEFTKCRPSTFYEDRAVHVDMTQPYCSQLQSCLDRAVRSSELAVSQGVYVCSEGPHLESPAQINMIRLFGDVVGMTGYPEVVLARELGLCYASLCVITNTACGINPKSKGLSVTEISELMGSMVNPVKEIISTVAQTLPSERFCSCKDALIGGKL